LVGFFLDKIKSFVALIFFNFLMEISVFFVTIDLFFLLKIFIMSNKAHNNSLVD